MGRPAQPEPYAPSEPESETEVVRLYTLGGLTLGGSAFTRPKPLLLLAYLALEGPQERRHLAELFWPEAADHLKSLTVALTQLRRGAPETFVAEGRHVRATVQTDVTRFVRALDAGALETALELYRGPFLDELYVSGYGEELEEWVYRTREGLAGRAREALLSLAEGDAAAGNLAAISHRAEAAYDLKGAEPPTPEQLGRLQRLLLAGGSPYAAAVREEALELGVRVTDSAQDALAELQRASPRARLLATLPHYATPFIGRAQEAENLRELLLGEPLCRLLTLVGPGGMGKTRLASEVARGRLGAFPSGVFFVPLAAAKNLSELVAAIAEALGFRFYSNVPPAAQLFDYLREKALLLILDNFEQLTAHAGFVAELVAVAPGVKVLVTSRESLHLQEEWVYPLEGLAYPHTGAYTPEDAEAYDALRLFEACARRAHVRFPIAAKGEHIVRLCRLVEGLPLALELAATWLRALPLETIVHRLEQGIAILETRQQGFEARHRSLRTVLEGSWELLSDEERAVLERLAVFRGGFHRKAAAAIAGASLDTLASLVEKSLLKISEGGRYSLHELLRQFAREKLEADAGGFVDTKTRHRAYFRAFLEARAAPLLGQGQRQAGDEIAEDFDNVRAFWRAALETPEPEAIDGVLGVIYHFCELRSRFLEGEALFAEAGAHVSARAPGTALATRILARHGAFHYFLCAYEAAERDLLRALAEAGALELDDEIPFILEVLGELAAWQGQRTVAEARFEESAARYRARSDKDGAACALENLANLIYATYGDYATSKRLASESLALSRELQRPDLSAYALDTLGFATFCLGEYGEAERHYRESLQLFEGSRDLYGTAMATGGVALVLWAVGGDKTSASARFFETSLTLCQDIGHKGQVAGRLIGLARVANDLGQYAEAQGYGMRGLEITAELNSPVYLAHILCCLGETAYKTGQLGRAQTQLARALEVSLSGGLLPHLAIALYHYAALLRRGERASEQEKALELAVLVSAHPATWQVYKDRAKALQAELERALPGESAARARSAQTSLEALASTLNL